jgi:hypothetical protein
VIGPSPFLDEVERLPARKMVSSAADTADGSRLYSARHLDSAVSTWHCRGTRRECSDAGRALGETRRLHPDATLEQGQRFLSKGARFRTGRIAGDFQILGSAESAKVSVITRDNRTLRRFPNLTEGS